MVKAQEDAKLREEKKLSEARREASLEILKAKNTLIKSTFQEALRRLENLPAGTYYTYLRSSIERSIEQLGSDELKINFNQADHKAQNKILKGLKLPKRLKLTVDEEPIETVGGFFISTGDSRIKINGTIEFKLAHVEKALRKEVSDLLFGD